MHPIFLAFLLIGLLLGVFAMLYGVERPSTAGAGSAVPSMPEREPAFSPNVPTIAAFAAAFGATGYLLARYSPLPPLPQLGIAAAVGGLGAVGAAALVIRWAIPGARDEVVDERYLLQGHPARVVDAISPDRTGTIEFEIEGARHTASARSLDDRPVAASTEVVIDRIEDGIAYVELWAAVEQRL